MAVTDVDVVRALSKDSDTVEAALQDWIDNTTFTTIHHVTIAFAYRGQVAYAIFYE